MKDVDGSTVRQVVERCVEELEKRRDRPPVVREVPMLLLSLHPTLCSQVLYNLH